MHAQGWVAVIDDDVSMRRALSRLLSSNGIQVESFPSIRHYLRRSADEKPACLVLDVNRGGDAPLEAVDGGPPIILMTGQDGVMSALLSRYGAVSDYLLKPFDPERLLERVQAHLSSDPDARPS
jgi:FixJ family two-component response regulator